MIFIPDPIPVTQPKNCGLTDKKGSERFWALEERIKKDRKAPGVILSVSKSDMLIDLVRLVQDEVIGLEDLSDFSEDVQERVKFMVQRW